jgi:hypothetical protein
MYQDEAADLMEAAAREESADAEPFDFAPPPFEAPPVQPPISRRPLPYPEPVGINDNLQRYGQLRPISERPRVSVARIVAWIIVAPWYATVAITSIGVDFFFAKSLLGL